VIVTAVTVLYATQLFDVAKKRGPMIDAAGFSAAKTPQMSSLKEGTHLLKSELTKSNILSVGKLYPLSASKRHKLVLVERCLHEFLP